VSRSFTRNNTVSVRLVHVGRATSINVRARRFALALPCAGPARGSGASCDSHGGRGEEPGLCGPCAAPRQAVDEAWSRSSCTCRWRARGPRRASSRDKRPPRTYALSASRAGWFTPSLRCHARHARPHRDKKHKLARTVTACISTMLQLLAGTSSQPRPAARRGGRMYLWPYASATADARNCPRRRYRRSAGRGQASGSAHPGFRRPQRKNYS
jgi:hypothetical protein